MTAKTCGTCKYFKPDDNYLVFGECNAPTPISCVCDVGDDSEHEINSIVMEAREGEGCPAHTDREPVCENHNWWRPVSVMDDANWKCITCNAEYPSKIKIKDMP